MRAFALALLVISLLAPAAGASPNDCASVSAYRACVFSGTYSNGACGAGGTEQSQIGVRVEGPQGYRAVSVDNGCYTGNDWYGTYEGSFVGANYDDGQPGDGFRRVHLNTGTGSTPNGPEDYCHVGIFNEQWQYTRLADCPPIARVPSVLPAVLALLP